MSRSIVRLCLFVFLGLNACSALAESWPGEQWAVQPSSQTAALKALEDYAFPPRDDATRAGIRSDALLVIRGGRVVYERYAGATTAHTPHLTWSISKSVLATVLGVAFSQGRFQLDDPVAKFYSPFQAHPMITLKDLLHWASGLDWQEDYEYAPLNSSVVAMLYTRGRDDMARFTANHGVASAAGTAYRYSSGDSNVLSAALKTMVGEQAYEDYPWTALFNPLGIRSATWETDGSGTFVGSSYTYMTARDLARIGLLMQRGGRWHEWQLLPVAWVNFVLTPFKGKNVQVGSEVPGGHWWLNRTDGNGPGPWPDAPPDTFAALGHWGQALYVIPSEDLVIVRYADDRDDTYDHNHMLKLLRATFGKGVGNE
ncbi:serine hydrolase domain-containing protein [Pseudomonas sp. NPDC089734]|uniref:serine hydrolase domain-containing protein n=1 Tax=Pseudomonas sp. NPDC089734 TaxID=3364469 RepID=UPI0037F48DAB